MQRRRGCSRCIGPLKSQIDAPRAARKWGRKRHGRSTVRDRGCDITHWGQRTTVSCDGSFRYHTIAVHDALEQGTSWQQTFKKRYPRMFRTTRTKRAFSLVMGVTPKAVSLIAGSHPWIHPPDASGPDRRTGVSSRRRFDRPSRSKASLLVRKRV